MVQSCPLHNSRTTKWYKDPARLVVQSVYILDSVISQHESEPEKKSWSKGPSMNAICHSAAFQILRVAFRTRVGLTLLMMLEFVLVRQIRWIRQVGLGTKLDDKISGSPVPEQKIHLPVLDQQKIPLHLVLGCLQHSWSPWIWQIHGVLCASKNHKSVSLWPPFLAWAIGKTYGRTSALGCQCSPTAQQNQRGKCKQNKR
jgi:hypothetical protein